MAFFEDIASRIPRLKDKLMSARIHKKPEVFVKEAFMSAMFICVGLVILASLIILRLRANILIVPVLFIVFFFFIFTLFLKRVDVMMIKRSKEIDRDVLFAGRFLLVKLNSGKPLINSLEDASQSYGVATKYFKEIVQDIELGVPMEDALDKAFKYTPSLKFKNILFQINNALKIGVDVSASLEATLDEIAEEQLIEIERYGKKLNSLIMFYMLLAIILPSLGITLFSVVGAMLAINIDFTVFMVLLFGLIIIQLIFMSVFKSLRPILNI